MKKFKLKIVGIGVVLLTMVTLLTIGVLKTADSDKDGLILKTLQDENNHWYYEIYSYDRLLIKQKTIPALEGNQYFDDQQSAYRVGNIVIDKLRKGSSPSISLNDLQNAGIVLQK